MKKISSKLIWLAAGLVLTACGKGDPGSSNSTTSAASTPAVSSNPGPNVEAAKALAEQRLKVEANKSADLKVPFENYSAVDNVRGKDQWLTYVAIAHANETTKDEELLSLFSGKYFNEADAFKKSEIGKTELPRIKEELARYKAQRYYKFVFNMTSDASFITPDLLFRGPFDLKEQTFDIGGTRCLEGTNYGNSQNVRLGFKSKSPEMCKWKVTDLELAKTVESFRAKNNANLRGTVYFFVSDVEGGNMVNAQVTRMKLEVVDKPFYLKGGNMVASFEL